MTEAINFDRPLMPADEVRVFIADTNSERLDIITTGLGKYGLADSLTVATSLQEAEAFINAQQPHHLDANVFLLSGGMDPNKPETVSHGRYLADQLVSKYVEPIREMVDRHIKEYEQLDITRKQRREIMRPNVNYGILQIAKLQVKSEALVVGISSHVEGALEDDVAQLPQESYHKVAKKVFQAIVPKRLRESADPETQAHA